MCRRFREVPIPPGLMFLLLSSPLQISCCGSGEQEERRVRGEEDVEYWVVGKVTGNKVNGTGKEEEEGGWEISLDLRDQKKRKKGREIVKILEEEEEEMERIYKGKKGEKLGEKLEDREKKRKEENEKWKKRRKREKTKNLYPLLRPSPSFPELEYRKNERREK
eukprot:CAMPEP_0201539954 /NCGR_PEP_ID=MMETSP0161_2-20130828/70682_1 /ASSEMBLY_ACC=CAM_ASM_000251 /TAXON_ID=180227 /ORGANISM="Neoparamoeba aestuarina, Strain SoJaBio B1-5/56/2" /LENGTH=163 /DNA_ID=CAMNT_0047947381 /DNA_START=633 /DNA_END=1122 /DNA_ORIENTATION=+